MVKGGKRFASECGIRLPSALNGDMMVIPRYAIDMGLCDVNQGLGSAAIPHMLLMLIVVTAEEILWWLIVKCLLQGCGYITLTK